MSANDTPLTFRAPSTSSAHEPSPTSSFTTPPLPFISGPWHVTHSTLPMWQSNQNVIITYTILDKDTTEDAPKIDDLVTYSPLNNPAKLKSVRGIDTPDPTVPAAYNWRGKGWLMIASSHWEVLGWGEEDGGWMVTFFAKTLFTPAGIDVYARRKGGLSEALLKRITTEVGSLGDATFQELAGKVFEIKHDW